MWIPYKKQLKELFYNKILKSNKFLKDLNIQDQTGNDSGNIQNRDIGKGGFFHLLAH